MLKFHVKQIIKSENNFLFIYIDIANIFKYYTYTLFRINAKAKPTRSGPSLMDTFKYIFAGILASFAEILKLKA